MSNIMTDAQSRALTYDITGDIDPADRPLHRDINTKCDCPYQNATLAAIATVQNFTAGDRTGGTFELDFTLVDGTTFSTAVIVFNAAASVVQTAVDVAAALAVTGYTAGDIAIAGGPVGTSTTTLTYSGNSVHGSNSLVVLDGTLLTGGTADPAEGTVTAGVVPRFWFAALKAMGVIEGTDPAFAAAPNGQYTATGRDELENYPSNETIKRLVQEATIQEGQDWNAELLPLLNIV